MADSINPNANNNIANFLPNFYRTDANKKFLSATINQLMQSGNVKKVNGYIGRLSAKSTSSSDIFINSPTNKRQSYQLEPGFVINDSLDNTTFVKDYQDYINQLRVFGGNVSNHARLNKQEMYSWDPHIDWDKFVNFQNYYWMPYGPSSIKITEVFLADQFTTFDVSLDIDGRFKSFQFNSNLTKNPAITLYRGMNYKFNITSPDNPFSIKTDRVAGNNNRFVTEMLENNATEHGTITFTVPNNAPDVLFYVSENDNNVGGVFKVLDQSDQSSINVENDIIGKQTYQMPNGTWLSNGMKISFPSQILPEAYSIGHFYVEGVGKSIQLINEKDLSIVTPYTTNTSVLFDNKPFDSLPFDDATGYASKKDYIVINRGSTDKNPWSRYNRWFHKDVIEISSTLNGQNASLDQLNRATRPIIEFEKNIKLFNYGVVAVDNISLIDLTTTDVFSTIEGTLGYNIDGVKLVEGQKIIFLADTDSIVKNNIYEVQFIDVTHTTDAAGVLNNRQIHLELIATPVVGHVALIQSGLANQGKSYWFNGYTWVLGQDKTAVNQPPLFDVVNDSAYSFGDASEYNGSSFKGTSIFSYKIGSGKHDTELEFPLSYKNIDNIGDIVFKFNLMTDTFRYDANENQVSKLINDGYLVTYDTDGTTNSYSNGWKTCTAVHTQAAVRVYTKLETTNNFDIDVYDVMPADLLVRVYVNGKRLSSSFWKVNAGAKYFYVEFTNPVQLSDVITIKTFSDTPINLNGYYEIPPNLQNNPINGELSEFTLGEVIDHVDSIVDQLDSLFIGNYPGASNMRDLGNISQYGTKFVQHSGPVGLSMYHITSSNSNLIHAIEQSRDDYNKFKRTFVQVAESLGIDTDPVSHVNLILRHMNQNVPSTEPYYFSDMVPYGASLRTDFTITDIYLKTYSLAQHFDLITTSNKAVLVYHNDIQMLHGRDYTFSSGSYIIINKDLEVNDVISIYEFENTDGCLIPETPTKIGAWPAYEPTLYFDTTLLTPKLIIQGHDGSQTLAYEDYRDELILELEKRIYNNIKVQYDPLIFDIADIIPSYNRTSEYSLTEFNDVLSRSFFKWSTVVGKGLASPVKYNNHDPFTFNYTNHWAPDGRTAPGYWRGIYQWMLDTDRPNLCPWEMLGFYAQPTWWTSVYGPAPYTSNNLILWEDISNGLIKEPGQPVRVVEKYKKPFLMDHLPVDEDGNLANPLISNLVTGVIRQSYNGDFKFGDMSPVEAAWRRSSYYSYSVILASVLLTPAKTIGVLFDRSRIIRNLTSQLVYKDTNLRVKLTDVVVPSIISSPARVQTAGLVNFVVNYVLSENNVLYNNYKTDLQALAPRLVHRVSGFTTKEKFKLLLDSKSPTAVSGVFVPDDDYKIVLNSSSPVSVLTYSGVIITKINSGFEISGYSKVSPYFNTYAANQGGLPVNIGGISEGYATWATGQTYIVGSVVSYNNKYYRVKMAHTSVFEFEPDNFIWLASLPVIGGQTALFRTSWNTKVVTSVPYGTKLSSIQEVVDFLIGHGKWLTDQGFMFDDFNSNISSVSNWETSAKEFMFWTTQNWSAGEDAWDNWIEDKLVIAGSVVKYNGEYYKALVNNRSTYFDEANYLLLEGLSTIGSSIITVSPAANKLSFTSFLSVADDITNPFNSYEFFNVSGSPISLHSLNVYREANFISIAPKNEDGVYCATFYLVQREHLVIINNNTMFNDTIYNPVSGYKQDKIKISGYISTEWDGSLNVPGFVMDQAIINDWIPWQDYAIGQIIKHRSFFYTANKFVAGSSTFDNSYWVKLDKKPNPKLIPNWSYKAAQFADFYSLDSDNFDVTQQQMAQHLIGYQKRQYLENIIQDDVSEFKFYQGMIIEKGTQNVLNKLFDVLSNNNQESLSFYEEWAIRSGQYGASSSYNNIEFVLDESKFQRNPQGFELVLKHESRLNDTIIRQAPSDVYLKPEGYTPNIWPVAKSRPEQLRSAGFVRADEVSLVVSKLTDLLLSSFSLISAGDYVSVLFEGNTWNVYRYLLSNMLVTKIEKIDTGLKFTVNNSLNDGDVIGITVNSNELNGFYTVVNSSLTTFEIEGKGLDDPAIPSNILIYEFKYRRINTIDDTTIEMTESANVGDLLWTDNSGNGKFATWKYNPVYSRVEIKNLDPADDINFGQSISTNSAGTILAVSTRTGDPLIFYKPSKNTRWAYNQTLFKSELFSGTDASDYSTVVSLSKDGTWLAVGSPHISVNNSLGFITIYKKDLNNIFSIVTTIQSDTTTNTELFGSTITFGDNMLYVTAKGTRTVYLYSFNILDNEWQFSSTLTNNVANSNFGEIIEVSVDNAILAISAPGNGSISGAVYVYRLDTLGYALSQLVTMLTDNYNFGASVSLSDLGKYIAVSQEYGLHKVIIYEDIDGEFEIIQTIERQTSKIYNIKFINDAETIAVFSSRVPYQSLTMFDSGDTTFDLGTTIISETGSNHDWIDVYDKYLTRWVFSEELSRPYYINASSSIYQMITAQDAIFISSPTANIVDTRLGEVYTMSGTVYEYIKPAKTFTWTIDHTEVDKPDVLRIKQAFLYNKNSNKLIKYLDVIDPLQGKFPGIAEQEIKFKSFYDVAVYTIGNDSVTVDEGTAWGEEQVGSLWWDLRLAKFINSYSNDVVYRNSTWCALATGASIDVYEWVESDLLPSEWDEVADTETGLADGISGTSLYGDAVYCTKKRYDNISQSFSYTYYYWVKNKTTVPSVNNRRISAKVVSNLISNPKGEGYEYLALTSINSFSLVNVKHLLEDKNVVLSIEYWTVEKTDQNIHTQWKLISSEPGSLLPNAIEEKWIDSLCGKDKSERLVPDITLPIKLRYGIENRPRQGMFVNRFNALKELIEQVNLILNTNAITYTRDLSMLELYDTAPLVAQGLYDSVINTDLELRFLIVKSYVKPNLTPIIKDGRIIGINIVNAGSGFIVAPFIEVVGAGIDAQLRAVINETGQIVGCTVINSGIGYTDTTVLLIRDYSVLVNSDSTSYNSWAIYSYSIDAQDWYKVKTQTYDTRKYWNYSDWYLDGYNQYSVITHAVDTLVDLNTVNLKIGELVKVRNSNSGGWEIFKKYSDVVSIDWTNTYSVVGIQNGTIQLSSLLYQFSNSYIGYDNGIYDNAVYDSMASTELRNILVSIRDYILIDDLQEEYLKLFFSSVRYAMSEQTYIDWIFKTSFVKVMHRVGGLYQHATYRNDNLVNFEDYVSEVKPYRTQIREYVSVYDNVESTQTTFTDFDLPPVYDHIEDRLTVVNTIAYANGRVVVDNDAVDSYPWKFWSENNTYQVIDVKITNQGSGYITIPQVKIVSDSGSGAIANAYIANGKVNRIMLVSKGSLYRSAPRVIIDGGLDTNGTAATAIAIIGNGVVRSNLIKIKFDRIMNSYYITNLTEVETFTGSGARLQFALKWAPDIKVGKSSVVIDGIIQLRDNYTLHIVSSTTRGYTSYFGSLILKTAPTLGAVIEVSYTKDSSILTATDRIQYYYTPGADSTGKDLAQLMTGVDYGGVIVDGIGFDTNFGWDSLPYYTDGWDKDVVTYNDYSITVAADTHVIELPYVPEDNTQLTVYYAQKIVDPIAGNGVDAQFSFNTCFKIPTVNLYRTSELTLAATAGSVTLTVSSTEGINEGDVISQHNVTKWTTTTSIESANSETNSVRVTSTTDLKINMPVLLSGVGFAGLLAGTYYVHTIINGHDIRLSSVINGAPVTISSELDGSAVSVGIMSVIVGAFSYNTTVESIINDTQVTLSQQIYTAISSGTIIKFSRPLLRGAGISKVTRTTVVLSFPPALDEFIEIVGYLDVVRLDDENFGTVDQTNANAVMETVNANHLTTQVNIPADFSIYEGDLLILRKIDSDGSDLNIDDYDTVVSGGNLIYSTAAGVAPDEIIIDGDDFVSETTSQSTEEHLPGQVVDAVAIKVFRSILNGSAHVKVDTFIASGSQNVFLVSQIPNNKQAVIVKLDNVIQEAGVEYTVNYVLNTVEFVSYPLLNSVISIFSIGFSGTDVADIDFYTYTGTNVDIVTQAAWSTKLTAAVYVNGEVYTSFILVNDNNRALIRLSDTLGLNQNDLVSYIIVENPIRTFAVTTTQRIPATGSYVYDLEQRAGESIPKENSIMVRVGQTFLTGSTNEYFTIKSNRLIYNLKKENVKPYSVSVDQISVIVDGDTLRNGIDYLVDLTIISIKLTKFVYTNYVGKTMTVNIVRDDEYTYINDTIYDTVTMIGSISENTLTINSVSSGIIKAGMKLTTLDPGVTIIVNTKIESGAGSTWVVDTPQTISTCTITGSVSSGKTQPKIKFAKQYNAPEVIEVISSYNHDILDIQRTGVSIPSLTSVSPANLTTQTYTNIRNGIIKLDRAVINDYYVWIVKNGSMLVPGIDYKLNDDNISVTMSVLLQSDDEITIITYSSNVISERMAYMQFKDMLNRIHYKRLNMSKQTQLATDLLVRDQVINLVDASNFETPSPEFNKPGIIEIRGERIEYFRIEGNQLSQLRRGTLGTGAPDVHVAGTYVQDIGAAETIPYSDKTVTETYESVGTNEIDLNFVPGNFTTEWTYKGRLMTETEVSELSKDAVEVFVSGTRLKKNSYFEYDVTLGPDSGPLTDVNFDADFTVDGTTELLTLSQPLEAGTQVTVVRQYGKIWDNIIDTQLTTDKIANFVNAVPGSRYV